MFPHAHSRTPRTQRSCKTFGFITCMYSAEPEPSIRFDVEGLHEKSKHAGIGNTQSC